MKDKVYIGLRILLGLMLVAFGVNKLYPFMPMPEASLAVQEAFTNLIGLKFILPSIAIIEILVGISMLLNKYTSIALVVLVPISYSIVAFHLTFDIAGIGGAVVVATINAVLLFSKREHFTEILKSNN